MCSYLGPAPHGRKEPASEIAPVGVPPSPPQPDRPALVRSPGDRKAEFRLVGLAEARILAGGLSRCGRCCRRLDREQPPAVAFRALDGADLESFDQATGGELRIALWCECSRCSGRRLLTEAELRACRALTDRRRIRIVTLRRRDPATTA